MRTKKHPRDRQSRRAVNAAHRWTAYYFCDERNDYAPTTITAKSERAAFKLAEERGLVIFGEVVA